VQELAGFGVQLEVRDGQVLGIRRHKAANAARSAIAGKVYGYMATGGFGARYKATLSAA
jgi:hypothetical protein